MKTPNAIRKMIEAQPLGTVFASAAFLSTGPRAAVDQALYLMVKQGALERVARGLYAAAGQSVQPQTAVLALANKTHEQLGLVWPSTVSDKFVVATSGQSRTLKMGKHVVQFRRMCQRKIRLASSPEGLVLLSLWDRGRENLTVLDIQQATKGWSEENIHAYAAQVPSWLYAGLKQAHAPRKSTKIGLSGAYDWSNPQIKDEVLIAKVLDKHKFEDVARLCFYFGVPKVKRVFKQHDFAPMASASVSRMLRNISKSLKPTSERPSQQIDFLKSAQKIKVSDTGFDVMGLDGLFAMKSIVVYDRVKSRDIYDLMILTQDHGYDLEAVFAAIDAYQPFRNKDPEYFKSVVTGVIPLDQNDEGFASIQLNVKHAQMHKYFTKLINDYEVKVAQRLRQSIS